MNHEVFAALGEALSRGEEAALVTIVSSNGSTPQRVGAKMLVFGDGRIVGTVGGGCYEHDAIGKARQVLQTRKPTTVKYDLNDDFAEETGLVCGGQMEVFIEPIEASPAVYIFGAGHVGYYLAKMAHEAGFGVHVIDDRAAFANTERFPFAASVVVDDIPHWLAQAQIPSTAYAVIVTRGHRNDLDVLRALAPRDLRYIGLIGSRAKVARLYEQLLAEIERRPGAARAHSRADRPRPRRRHAAGNRRQHHRRADRGPARQGRGAQVRLAAMVPQPQSPSLIVRGATIVTMNDAFDVIEGDVLIRDGRIASVGAVDRDASTSPDAAIIEAHGAYLLPGFIQTHIHLCQTLFRGYADDLALLDWLKTRVWPMEAAHTPRVARRGRAASRIGAAAIGHDHGADDGDRARHRCGVRSARADGPARRRRQVHDGRRLRGPGAAAGRHRAIDRRERGDCQALARARQWPPARRLRAAVRGVVLARAARGGGAAGDRASARHPHACLREPRRDRADQVAHRPEEHRLPGRHRPDLAAPLPRPLRLGR